MLTLYIASNNCPIRTDFSRQISKVKVETKKSQSFAGQVTADITEKW